MPDVTIAAIPGTGDHDPTAAGDTDQARAADARLPRLPVNCPFGRGEIDRRSSGVAAGARDGAVSAVHARRVIAALLYGS